MSRPVPRAGSSRLGWLDTARGISIVWIAFFHFLIAYDNGRYPWPLSFSAMRSFSAQCAQFPGQDAAGCVAEGLVAALFQRGPHAVGVFLVLSGFGMTLSLARTGGPQKGWARWYWRRCVRLFPMYWLAHLLYLVSPFILRPDPADWRLALSFIGDRVFPVDQLFFYANPAWWFFGLLLELCLVFPLLFGCMNRCGPVRFLAACGVATVASRYLLTQVIHAHGDYLQGAFFGARLFEFAAGMALACACHRAPAATETRLFSRFVPLAGLAVYALGVYCYRPGLAITLSDGLTGVGLFLVIAHVSRWVNALPRFGSVLAYVGAYSYGIYLIHQPYMMYVGDRLKDLGMAVAVPAAAAVLGAIVLGGSVAERALNRLTR
ncbi:MAG: acyltransferase [bacterium]